jgi:hypothetical protein
MRLEEASLSREGWTLTFCVGNRLRLPSKLSHIALRLRAVIRGVVLGSLRPTIREAATASQRNDTLGDAQPTSAHSEPRFR